MAEYGANANQNVSLNNPIIMNAIIPCTNGYVYHEDETGIFMLKGKTNNCFTRYRCIFCCNVAIPEGGAVTPVAVAISVNGEPKLISKAIYVPSAVSEFGNILSVATITVPRGCCFSMSVDYVDATTDDPTTTPTPSITVANTNLIIDRIVQMGV